MEFNSSEQTISWLRDRYREGTLIIKPTYQRKPVWTARQKCYLIESILLGLPIPEVYIQQTISPEGDTEYGVVDGQQRIRTILQFIGVEADPQEQEHNKFPLDKLSPQSTWVDLTFGNLSDEQKRKFYGYNFAIRYLRTDSGEEVRDMFRRLNKFLTPLNAQELRNATYEGPFTQLALILADNRYWVENRIVSPALIRRMNDVEFVSELLIGVLHGPQGGSAGVVDSYYEQYENYDVEFPEQDLVSELFNSTLQIIQTALPNIKETRWSNKTDFYTLFVCLSTLLREMELIKSKASEMRKALEKFSNDVYRRLSDETAKVSSNVVTYVRAHEKGANDKKRRGDRHVALLKVVKPFFRARRATR
jgi:hypothetical protein